MTRITPESVQQTDHYKTMDRLTQLLIIKHGNMIKIENGVNVSASIGFEKWNHQTHPRHDIKMIVGELSKKLTDEQRE